ncbi:MAG: SctK family type III secretion system sorting platform protein [Geminicoccaceae bacterium]
MPFRVRTRTTGTDPALLRDVIAFNFSVVDYMCRERLKACFASTVDDDLLMMLQREPRIRRRLSTKFLKEASLLDEPVLDFSPSLRQLALLDGTELSRIARYAGGLWYAHDICRLIARSTIAKVKTHIGDDAYRFVVKQGALSKRSETPLGGERDLISKIDGTGFACLASWLALEPKGLSARVLLKFPPRSPLEQSLKQRAERRDADTEAVAILRRVLRHGDSRWHRYVA